MRDEGGVVLQGRLTRSQTLIMSKSVLSTQSSPDQVARSGLVGPHQQIGFYLLVRGDRGAQDDEVGGWSGGFRRH
jgi:hypothetical protein